MSALAIHVSTMKGRKPTYDIYSVEDGQGQGGKDRWTRQGAAWPTKDGKGMMIHLRFGKLVALPYRDKAESKDGDAPEGAEDVISEDSPF